MTIQEIKRANRKAGQYFFSPDTMRFFASRVSSSVFEGAGGIYFITSEKKCFDDNRRVFHVRRFNPNGSVSSIFPAGETYQAEFKSGVTARKYAKGWSRYGLKPDYRGLGDSDD